LLKQPVLLIRQQFQNGRRECMRFENNHRRLLRQWRRYVNGSPCRAPPAALPHAHRAEPGAPIFGPTPVMVHARVCASRSATAAMPSWLFTSKPY
jgi:hypothetical protein